MVRGTSARPVDGQILRKEEGVLEGCMEGRGDGWLLGTVEGVLEGCIDRDSRKDGLGDIEGADDGHVLPIGIDTSSKVKFPPSWIRMETTNTL